MINEKVFLGLPINFQNKFYIYPPKIKDVYGNEHFSEYKALFCLTQEDLEDSFLKDNEKRFEKNDVYIPTPFEYMLALGRKEEKYDSLIKEGFRFFIKQEVSILYENGTILIGNLEEELEKAGGQVEKLILLTEEDFFDFQNLIRMVLGEKEAEKPDANLHPKIKRMKALARYRDKVKAKSGKGLAFSTIMSSICCMGIGITPLNIGELTYASVFELLERYQEKEKYNIDIRSILAGASSKKIKPKYWIRNLQE